MTVLKPSQVRELVAGVLWPEFAREKARLDKVDRWYRWSHEDPRLPRGATAELKYLLELSKTPWLGLVVTTVAQALYVDGFRSPEVADNSEVWKTWLANDFDSRQIAVHRSALAYGLAFGTVMPGQDASGPRAVLRGVSPRKMIAVYADPAEDDWPMYAMRVSASGGKWMLRVIDEEAVYFASLDATSALAGPTAASVEFIEWREHGAGVCPVVRYANQLDLEGRTPGEVEPLIPLAARIDKTDYDRMLVQHFNSWKVRTIAGLSEFADDEEEANRKKLRLRQDDVLVAEDADTKFGTLDETPLDGFINAKNSDVETLAAVAQVPATSLTGKVANLSAEAIAELRAGLSQKCYERQIAFGKSHRQMLRLAAELEGRADVAGDVTAAVTWQDMQVRSMSQAADALGKYATMLQVPIEALWQRIPGVTKSDVDDWKRQARRDQGRAAIADFRSRAAGVAPVASVAPVSVNGTAG